MKALVAMAIFFATFTVAARFTTSRAEPDAARGHWAVVNGHRLYFEIMGSGTPLLLLHGGGDSIDSSFSKQLVSFSSGHEVIAPEQVGHGHTPDLAAPLSYSEMMEDTASLLKQLRVSRVDVVGWSDGGILALMLAAHHPELVRRLVVSGANISPDGLEERDLDAMRRDIRDARHDSANFGEKLTALWLSAPTRTELSADLLGRIQQPVLVMSGDHDVIRLEHTLQIYRALPKGQLYILPDTHHGTFEERPQWVNPVVLSFLAQS
jgi:pimeloyl-ACP methyl ester carboxylesterase